MRQNQPQITPIPLIQDVPTFEPMSDLAIRVENLSKLYRIGARQERCRTLPPHPFNVATFKRSNDHVWVTQTAREPGA
jgi:hypothetical protein